MAIPNEWYDEALFVLRNYTLKYCKSRALHLILKQSDIIHLNSGDVLFSQNDASTNVYVVIRGRLSAELPSERDSEPTPMVFSSRGALLGEIGIITGAPRSMHVIANRDAILIQIPSKVFEEIYIKYIASDAAQINALYLTQLGRNKKLFESASKNISYNFTTLIPASPSVSLNEFIDKIKTVMQIDDGFFILPDEILTEITQQNKITDYFIEIEKQHKHILIVVTAKHLNFIEEILDFSDRVIIVANGYEPPSKSEITKNLLSPRNRHAYNIRNVLLIHRTYYDKKFSSEWIKLKQNLQISNYFENDVASLERVYRHLCGRTVGLVLSGAGYRGIAYIGALKALVDYNIPIDIIGGTSMGAIIGAYFVASHSIDEFNTLISILIKDINRTFSWREIVFPKSSIFSGKSSMLLATKLNEYNIEDLQTPFFCVSCDLSVKKEVHHFNGKLGDALRASSAVPGLLPPMVIDGHLLVDGAVVNNTPVNVMRSIVSHEGTVITIDLSNLEVLRKDYPNLDTLYTSQTIKNFFLRRPRRHMPDLRKILLTSFLMHGESKLEANMELSTVYIKPDLSQYSFLPSGKTTKEQLILLGYQSTVEAIKSHPILLQYHTKKNGLT